MPTLTSRVTVSTGAYSAGDVIGGLMRIERSSTIPNKELVLQNLHISSIENIAPTGNILIFRRTIAGLTGVAVADNAAFSYGTAKVALEHEIANISVVADDWITVDSIAKADIDTRGRVLDPQTGQDLYAVFVTDGAPDWTAAVELIFRWGILPA